MGLGKTLTVIAFTVTLLTNPKITSIKINENKQLAKLSDSIESTQSNLISSPIPNPNSRLLIQCILIIAPKNTLQNWKEEYRRWTPFELTDYTRVKLLEATDTKSADRLSILRKWHNEGGVLIMGYSLFLILTDNTKYLPTTTSTMTSSSSMLNSNSTKTSKNPLATSKLALEMIEQRKYLLNPGPDLVVADEAHTIKSSNSATNKVLSQIKTKRRIALTGSPLQNNLEEYFVMVNWVKERSVLVCLHHITLIIVSTIH